MKIKSTSKQQQPKKKKKKRTKQKETFSCESPLRFRLIFSSARDIVNYR